MIIIVGEMIISDNIDLINFGGMYKWITCSHHNLLEKIEQVIRVETRCQRVKN